MTVAHSSDDEVGPSRAGSVRVAILDREGTLLRGLERWLNSAVTGFQLVATAGSWRELVLSSGFPAELVMLDLEETEPVPIEARVRTCRAAGARVIVMSGDRSEHVRTRALAAGAAAFVLTSDSPPEVLDIARSVVGADSGVRTLDWRVRAAPVPARDRARLSQGETEALVLYASGLTTPQVAERMNVQFETAKTYLRRVRQKYAKVNRPASNRAELVVRATEDGLLS